MPMPLYDFRCEECGHKFTVLVGVEERHKVTCPQCASRSVKQLITPCAVQVKGGGGSCGGTSTAGAGGG